MATVRTSIHLPYLLALPPGEYPTPGVGGSLRLADGSVTNVDGTAESRTEASTLFDAPDAGNAETQERQREVEADRLLRRVNRLLRWYRVATGQAAIIELTRAQASPFRFIVEGTGAVWGGDATLDYEAASLPVPAKGWPRQFWRYRAPRIRRWDRSRCCRIEPSGCRVRAECRAFPGGGLAVLGRD